MTVPADPPIFHITHTQNLASILREGGLWCDAQRVARSIGNTNIGHLHIKERRLARRVTTAFGGTLGDYVPFNFCPRSVMLYAVHRGHHDYRDGQEGIVHLVSSVAQATSLGRKWAFSDRHAELAHALHFDDLRNLSEVRWDAMRKRDWRDVKEERQAEFLVHDFFPWTAVTAVAAMTPSAVELVRLALRDAAYQPPGDRATGVVLLTPMPIEAGQGSLLAADVDALVNPVNTMVVMGKGLALQFRKAFPECFASYERACAAGEVVIGRMHIVERLTSPRFIVNFPTKRHWRQPSKLEYVRDGLGDLVTRVRELGIASIAVPPLGCGNGGLQWSTVKPLILEAFAALPDVRVVLFEPGEAPTADQMIDRRPKPTMTAERAAVLALMGRYVQTGYEYRLSLVEVQKLAYFLQAAGENLRLEYRPHHYGPYADNLRKALRNLEGHYTRGVGDGKNAPDTPLELLPGAVESAHAFLQARADTLARLERVATLIDGFETPFGMELLGTVHWVMSHGANAADLDAVIADVHAWSARKRSAMKDGHIRAAWARLHEQGWAPTAAM